MDWEDVTGRGAGKSPAKLCGEQTNFSDLGRDLIDRIKRNAD